MSTRYSPQISSNGLVLYLDAANPKSYVSGSSTWMDLSGKNYNATLINSPTFNSKSLIFNGTNNIAYTPNIELSNTNVVTVSMFCKMLNLVQYSAILFEMSNDNNSSNVGFLASFRDSSGLFQSTYPIALALRGNGGYNFSGYSNTLISDLKWHYLTFIFDKSVGGVNPLEESFYVDGVQATPTIIPVGFTANNTNNFGNVPLFIGARSGSLYSANAEYGCIQLYNRALTSAEILQNYNALKGRFGIN